MCIFSTVFPFSCKPVRGTIQSAGFERGKFSLFFKIMEEKCAGIRLYGKENLRVFGCSLRRTPREEVKVMRRKRVGICLLMLMLTLVGGRAFAQSAVVNNGSDAAARLNMRGQPSKDADSLGQFYTGTPVNIVSDAGNGWSQVTIGSGNNSLSGYMMTAYLSADASSVTDATLYMEVTSPYGTQSIIVRSEPSNSYDAVAALVVGDSVRVIGTAGSYYYVLLSDQSVGCLSTSEVK